MRKVLTTIVVVLICTACGAQVAQRTISSNTVLVVVNTKSEDSVAIGAYYVQKRHIPPGNVCRIECPTAEECSEKEYRDQMEKPVKDFIAKRRLKIDYIVLTKGEPIRIHEGPNGGLCTDSMLAVMDLAKPATRMPNPYFNQNVRFKHSQTNLYLVTRLIGYTRVDCLKLIDHSVQAKPVPAAFLLHTGPGHDGGGYRQINEGMRRADQILLKKHLRSILTTGDEFTGGRKDLMGYYSWGSNDAKYDKRAYRSLGFVPGGIAETAVSTSARTFENPEAPGQSLIGDLVAQGATGCKGYVSEPYSDALAHADILFDRYTSGYSLAESFYASSAYINWKDMVIGDPLCAPYATK